MSSEATVGGCVAATMLRIIQLRTKFNSAKRIAYRSRDFLHGLLTALAYNGHCRSRYELS
jgi:hypothetical protein